MIIDKLSQLKNLTTQEKAVADYIIKEPWKLLETSIHDLSVVTYTSASTIMRLSKKLGYSGFSDFKFHFASEFPLMVYENEADQTALIREDTDNEEILQRLPLLYLKVIEQTRSFIDSSQISRCASALVNSEYVPIFATGLAFSMAQIFQFKFQEIGIPATANNSMNWRQLAYLKTQNVPSFAILISLTGENSNISEVALHLKKLEIPFLLISANPDTSLKRISTEFMRIYWTQRDELANSRYVIAVQFILDAILAAIIVKKFPIMKKTHELMLKTFLPNHHKK